MNNNIISINDLFKDTPTGEESREGGRGEDWFMKGFGRGKYGGME